MKFISVNYNHTPNEFLIINLELVKMIAPWGHTKSYEGPSTVYFIDGNTITITQSVDDIYFNL